MAQPLQELVTIAQPFEIDPSKLDMANIYKNCEMLLKNSQTVVDCIIDPKTAEKFMPLDFKIVLKLVYESTKNVIPANAALASTCSCIVMKFVKRVRNCL